MTRPTPEALRKLVAEARELAAEHRSGEHRQPTDPKANYRTRAMRLFEDSALTLTGLADALEPLLDASERVGERDGPALKWGADAVASDAEIDYIMRYGGRCRGCADEDGVCPSRGLPCDPEDARRAIRHVLNALNYGRAHGYLVAPQPPGAPEGGWRDIESAPRDGTLLWLLEPGRGPERRQFVGWWDRDGEYWQDDADSEPDPAVWQPLPEPPHE